MTSTSSKQQQKAPITPPIPPEDPPQAVQRYCSFFETGFWREKRSLNSLKEELQERVDRGEAERAGRAEGVEHCERLVFLYGSGFPEVDL